jgi:hypothetical protein
MSYQRHTIRIELAEGDYAHALEIAQRALATFDDHAHSPYWTPLQVATYGYAAEIGMRRHLGASPRLILDGTRGGSDVGSIQVKAARWDSGNVQARQHGGHVYVPTEPQHSLVIAHVATFTGTLHRRVFYEGWMWTADARTWPVVDGYRPAHAVPYSALHPPWASLPAQALQCWTCHGSGQVPSTRPGAPWTRCPDCKRLAIPEPVRPT